MPKRLLRGVIDFGDHKLNAEQLNSHYRRLFNARFDWHNPDERKIFEYIKDYVQENHEPPTAATIKDFFERANDLTVTEKLLDIKSVEVYTSSSYKVLLQSLLEEQNQGKVRKLLTEVEEIVTKGLVIGTGKEKQRYQGVKEGLQYFNKTIYEVIPENSNARTEGEVLEDAGKTWEQYQRAKADKSKAYGKFTGLEAIDNACHGIKRGELWIHAAYTGELKTTFALNWAYNLVTRYKTNVLYVSLEMPYQQLQLLTCALHTANPKYLAAGRKPLEYAKMRDGELAPEDELYLHEVLKDFETNRGYCKFRVWAPDHDVSIGDIRIYAELLHKSLDIGLIVIDHAGLVKAGRQNKDYGVELNTVMRDAKKLALQFNSGEGVPVVLLHQINRQGKDSVMKEDGKENEGVYRPNHLSYANEAERSADYLTTTYLNDDLKLQGETIICNLKNRDNKGFAKFRARVDWSCRRLRNRATDSPDISTYEMSADDMAAMEV
jgi:replicative DNA helicase